MKILVDLLMPASGRMQGDKGQRFVGRDMPVGVFLALLAAKNGCAKHIAVFTDSSHHNHPASACLDDFNSDEYRPESFTVEDAKVILTNKRKWVLGGEKHWDMVLDYLINGYQDHDGDGVA